eukprot:GHVU01207820.1.p1 GENE.GHVU01207820.1~~GHVU01207820.1.p1  ORF type:complete len:459 (+),score=44.62 GHVU01207820.1:72-1448(+)
MPRLSLNLFRLLCLIGIVAAPFRCAEARKDWGEFELSNKTRFHYISKFGCNIGACDNHFSFQVLSVRPHVTQALHTHGADMQSQLKVRMFLDEEWETMDWSKGCDNMGRARGDVTATVPINGTWSADVHLTSSQSVRPHMWYFVLETCDGQLQNDIVKAHETATVPTPLSTDVLLRYWTHSIQEGGSEYGYEYLRMRWWVHGQLLLYFAIGGYFIGKEVAELRTKPSLPPMVQVINLAFLLQIVATVLHLVHLWVYNFNGTGVSFLDGGGTMFDIAAQIVKSSLLICIAMGYSLTTSNLAKGADYILPVGIVVTCVHVVMVGFSNMLGDTRYQYHPLEGPVGWALVVIRFVLYAVFVYSWKQTAERSSNLPKLMTFLKKFFTVGTIYFLSIPLIHFISGVFAPYLRVTVMWNMTFLVQLSCFWYLGVLFFSKGEFFQVSERGKSFLPGGLLQVHDTFR